MPPVCIVCGDKPPRVAGTMCRECQRSFDRQVQRDGTTLGLIAWASKRARRVGVYLLRRGCGS